MFTLTLDLGTSLPQRLETLTELRRETETQQQQQNRKFTIAISSRISRIFEYSIRYRTASSKKLHSRIPTAIYSRC